MATKRTPEEILEIVDHCVQLEQEGGDILGYLWSENYISPRATWMNFQREHLHRKPYEFTDGKPSEGRKKMFRVTDEIRTEAIRIAMEGGDPRLYLEEKGSKAPDSAWGNIRKDLRERSPEILEQLPARIGAKPVAMKVKLEKKPKKLGSELAKPGTVPLQYDGYEVRCIRGKYGEFYWDKTHGYLDWRTNDGEEVSMTPAAWMEFGTEEVRKVIGILGAMPAEEN